MILFLKGGSGSGNHGHGGRPGQVGGSAKAPPSSSAEINSLSDAEAYWSKHFNTGSAIPIDCKYGKRRYHFAVTFQRNHAYTKDSLSVAADQYRSFDIDRAQSMDRIFEVLRNPHVVTWSKTPGNKVFDRTLNVDSQHGRVVLEPTPTPEDIAAGVVTHFLFVSWHTINRGQFDDAARQAKARHVAPTQIKKAIQQSDGLSSRTPSVVTLGQSPASEGIPFNWSPYFYGMHSRNLGSDVDAGSLSGADGTSLLSKASIPAGARWITVHPNGADSKGQPVLIQPQPDGSAHVIGGAGGKLNYLKLRAVRKESDYQKEVQAKKDAGTAAKKEQRKKDKEAGLVESKKKARDAVKEQRRQHEAAFVDTVADTLGWDKSNLAFPEDDYAHLSDAAQAKVRQKHHQEIMRRATEAVELQRQQLVNDPEARRSAGIDVIPLDANGVEQLSVQDLSPIPNTSAGLGFSTDYKERAEAAGLSGDELARETGAVKEKKEAGLTEGQKRGAYSKGNGETPEGGTLGHS